MHTKQTKSRKWQKIALVGFLAVSILTSLALPCFATDEGYASKMLTPDIPLNMTLTYKNGYTFSTSLADNVDTTATEYPNVVFNDGYNAIKKGINSSVHVPDDVYPFNERMQYNGSLYAEDMKEVDKVSFNATSFIISRAKGAYNGVTDTLDQMFEFSMPAYMCADVVISYDIYFGGVDPEGDITKRYVIRNDEGLKITPITLDDIDNVAPNEDWEYAMIHNFFVEIDIIAYTYGVEGASVEIYTDTSVPCGVVIVVDGVVMTIEEYFPYVDFDWQIYVVGELPYDIPEDYPSFPLFYNWSMNDILTPFNLEQGVWLKLWELIALYTYDEQAETSHITSFGGVITDISEATENDTYYFLYDSSVDYTYPSDTPDTESPTPEMVDPSFEFLRFTYSAVNPEAYGEPEGLYVGYWNEWIYPIAPENFQEGYEFGYSEGYEKGYKTGYGETSPNITQWLSTAVGGILTFELLPGISFLGILGVIISIALAIALLKFFAGG